MEMPEGAKMNKQKGGAVDPFSYPDKTDRGQTEAHLELGRDKQSFMFEQVNFSHFNLLWTRFHAGDECSFFPLVCLRRAKALFYASQQLLPIFS